MSSLTPNLQLPLEALQDALEVIELNVGEHRAMEADEELCDELLNLEGRGATCKRHKESLQSVSERLYCIVQVPVSDTKRATSTW